MNFVVRFAVGVVFLPVVFVAVEALVPVVFVGEVFFVPVVFVAVEALVPVVFVERLLVTEIDTSTIVKD